MSTFSGKLAEIEGISIDRFDGENLNSEAFFLSHCHTDHMVGLGGTSFHEKLVEKNLHLHLSHVSAAIVKKTFPLLSENLIELDQHLATTVVLSSGKSFGVTPVPAGHCPGSVMFLFEAEETVLYTGDYRISSSDIPKFNAFYNSMDMPKQIHSVYLDTTFFLKDYLRFPRRADSLEEICSIIQEWIFRSDKHVIHLSTSAKYGYEYLFIEIYKRFKMPVHVNDEAYELYSRVPEMDHAVTRSGECTQIHSACGSIYTTICISYTPYKVKCLKASAMRWRSNDLDKGISENSCLCHYVCYSTHASYEEGVQLLEFLKPTRIHPNVLYKNTSTNQKIYENIEEILNKVEPSPKRIKLFDVKEVENRTTTEVHIASVEDCCIMDSPPRNRTTTEVHITSVEDCCILDSPPRHFTS